MQEKGEVLVVEIMYRGGFGGSEQWPFLLRELMSCRILFG